MTKVDLKEQRRLLYDFIIFMANTGIRPSEAKQLRWRHVDISDKLIKLDAAITKNKKPREVVGRDPAITRVRAIRKRQAAFLKPHGQSIKPSDFVFALPKMDGGNALLDPVDSFKTSFRSLLKACGFEYDEHNQRHSITSLRHTYATFRLIEGTSMDLLALNMGTSVRMIENHYGHVRTVDQRYELTKMRAKSGSNDAYP